MTKSIIKNCIPTVFSLMMTGLYSVIDGLFIGKATGDSGLAAINIAWPITAIITAIGIGVGSGGSVLLSNYIGRGEKEESENIYHNTVLLMVIIAIIITFLLMIIFPVFLRLSTGGNKEVFKQGYDYCKIIVIGCTFQLLGAGFIPLLRNMNLTIHAMIILIVGMIINLIANYYLIFNVGLGIQGAAIGTITAQLIVTILSVFLIYGYKKKKFKYYFSLKRSIKILKTGLSSFGMSIAPSVTLIFTNMQCLKYGGEAAVACYATISYIVFPIQSMLCGVGEGVQPMISYYNGEDRKDEVENINKIAKIIVLFIGSIAFTVVMKITPEIPKWFGLSYNAEKYFSTGMIISAFSFFIFGVVKFNSTYLYSILRIKEAIRMIYGETLIISPILLWLLPLIMGINGVWLSLVITSVVMQLIYMIFVKDSKRKNNKDREKGNLIWS